MLKNFSNKFTKNPPSHLLGLEINSVPFSSDLKV